MQPDNYPIRLAQSEDLPKLPAIEQAAANLFRSTDYAFLADAAPLPLNLLNIQQEQGLVWVATDQHQPIGFAVVHILDGTVHLHELDVDPAYGRRGIGRRLVLAVCNWAKTAGYSAMTLSTFREIRWNAPFYASLGFRILAEEELSSSLLEMREQETQAGLPIEQRVCMRLDL